MWWVSLLGIGRRSSAARLCLGTNRGPVPGTPSVAAGAAADGPADYGLAERLIDDLGCAAGRRIGLEEDRLALGLTALDGLAILVNCSGAGLDPIRVP